MMFPMKLVGSKDKQKKAYYYIVIKFFSAKVKQFTQ